MTIYLIDFENVSIGGLKGASDLGQQDLVFLFSSKNAARLTTATLATFNSTTLKFVEVPVKKQSLDMHLVSYLGYLIGTTDAEHFIIISNDHDYDNIMAFWRANGRNVVIERRGSISPQAAAADKPAPSGRSRYSRSSSRSSEDKQSKKSFNSSDETKTEKTAPAGEEKNDAKKPSAKQGSNKTQAPAKAENTAAVSDKTAAVKEALSKVYDENVCEDVLRIIAAHSEEHNPLTSIHNDLRDSYKDPDYLEIYKLIKPVLSDSSAAAGKRRKPGQTPKGDNAAAAKDRSSKKPEDNAKEQGSKKPSDNAKNDTVKKRGKDPAQKNRPNSDVTRINNEVQKLLSKAKFETEIISFVAGLASKNHAAKGGKMTIYRSIISKYGREKGLEIYDRLKPLFADTELWK